MLSTFGGNIIVTLSSIQIITSHYMNLYIDVSNKVFTLDKRFVTFNLKKDILPPI